MNALPSDLLVPRPEGLYCPAGDFFIDPWRPVARAVVTHAHSDHARWGSQSYLVAREGEGVARIRLGDAAHIESLDWAETRRIGDVLVSLHPAGHILGSAQVRIEHRGETWVVTGDYKRQADPTTRPFEPLRCDVLITECTFGLPVYRWPDPAEVAGQIAGWWKTNRAAGRTSVLLAYSLGKAQRLLAMLPPGEGPVLVHGAVERLNEAYRAAGVALPPTQVATPDAAAAHRGQALVVAPPSAATPGWLRKFGPTSVAVASGWMRVRGIRRRRSVDRGFVVSDHADWPGLLATVRESGAGRVGVTHGQTGVLVRWLEECEGVKAWSLPTAWQGERMEGDDPGDAE